MKRILLLPIAVGLGLVLAACSLDGPSVDVATSTGEPPADLAAVDDTEPRRYTPEVRDNFVGTCVAAGGERSRDICECTWDEITETMPFEEFVAIEAAISSGTDDGAAFGPIVLDCIRSVG